ncbi:HAD family hydrolase [Hydrogenophaga sp. T2]|uniref:HAD family hydrolase n=1 Tax=Hydrogenophaga sp. T2 TaxID=3132823 RepID=UPI003CFB7134
MAAVVFRGVRAVLFDLDGTLIDSAPDLGAAAEALRKARGLPPLALDAYRAHAGSGARGMLRVAFDLTPDHPTYPAMRDEFLSAYERCMLIRTQAFHGVDGLLQTLSARRIGWGVVTNKAQRFALPIAQAMPVLAGAGAIVCGDTTPHAKPHPAPLLEAARRLALEPSDCIYVGDDLRDIQAGKAAGMRTVAARYGYLGASAAVDDWAADAVIDSPAEVLNLLELP